MSIRLRLTLLYSAILALTLVASSVVVYVALERATRNVIQNELRAEAQALVNSQVVRFGQLILPASRFATPQTFVQAADIDGNVTDRSANLGDATLPLSRAGLRAVRDGQAWFEMTRVEGEHLAIYSTPLRLQGQIVGILQLARSLADQDAALSVLQRILIAGSALVTLIACVVGWLLAGTALRPIERITRTARDIGAERNFARRVQHAGPNDELGRLVTTLNAMLTELEAAYRQSETSLEAQRRFVADASHELRTPLTTLRGNLALLQREPRIREEDRVAVVQDMVDEVERMTRLVRGLLTLARADAGQPLRREPVVVADLIEDVCRDALVLAPGRLIDSDRPAGLAVAGDRDALKQVLLILVDNALKYTPRDERVVLGVTGEDGRVKVSVRDTGPGIPADVVPHIFERFYRGDESRTGTGAGLGLAIARTLVEGQGGAISVESELGRGSTFTVELPRAGG